MVSKFVFGVVFSVVLVCLSVWFLVLMYALTIFQEKENGLALIHALKSMHKDELGFIMEETKEKLLVDSKVFNIYAPEVLPVALTKRKRNYREKILKLIRKQFDLTLTDEVIYLHSYQSCIFIGIIILCFIYI